MEYYQNIITAKSFQILQELKRQYDFILIGGWAVFLYTHTLKSKDIDIIVDYPALEKLRADFDLRKNDRLKKYEISRAEIDVDIYLPHYSKLGLPLENIPNYCQAVDGFKVPKQEVLLILKQVAYADRRGSAKGVKDKIDIISLLTTADFDFEFYKDILDQYNLKIFAPALKDLVRSVTQVPELGLNQYQYAKLKKTVLASIK